MIKYEMKKLLKHKTTFYALLFLLTWTIGSIIYIICSTEWVDGKTGNTIKGFAAIHAARMEKSVYNGILSEDYIADIISENKSIIENSAYLSNGSLSNIGYAKQQGFSDIRDLINRSFSGFSTYNYYTCDSLSPDDSALFYQNRITALKEWIASSENTYKFNDVEKDYLIHSFQSLSTPFDYSYMDGWSTLFQYVSILFITCILVICISIAPCFSSEYQSGAVSAILTSKYGRSKVIHAKMIASFLLTTITYVVFMTLFSVSILCIYGFSGANCTFQANASYWKCIYNLTNFQAYGVILLIGYVGCLLMSTFALLLSSALKSSFASIIITFTILILPQFVDNSILPGWLQNVFTLFPHQTSTGVTLLLTYNLYTFGNIVITPIYILPILYPVICLLVVPFTKRCFQKHQIMN